VFCWIRIPHPLRDEDDKGGGAGNNTARQSGSGSPGDAYVPRHVFNDRLKERGQEIDRLKGELKTASEERDKYKVDAEKLKTSNDELLKTVKATQDNRKREWQETLKGLKLPEDALKQFHEIPENGDYNPHHVEENFSLLAKAKALGLELEAANTDEDDRGGGDRKTVDVEGGRGGSRKDTDTTSQDPAGDLARAWKKQK